jgi:peroxiredoxin
MPPTRCTRPGTSRRPEADTAKGQTIALAPGTDAPDFTLKDQDGNDVTLSSFRDTQNVVLVFYPFTFTGVCEGELCAARS